MSQLLRGLALVCLVAGCDGARAPGPAAEAGPTCDTPAACCRSGDAAACEPAAVGAADGERRELLIKGCELGRAPSCLRAAALHLGQDAARVSDLADRGCKLDPRVWIPGAQGQELSCAYFERELAERAQRLGASCRSAVAGSCRALGDLLRPYDEAMAEHAHAEECSAGGLAGEALLECERFLEFLATPPRCPTPSRVTTVSYGRCPSEAKGQPRHMGRLSVKSPTEVTSQPLRRAVEASEALKYCYAAGLVDAPRLAGSVRLSVRVEKRGRLFGVSTTGSHLDDPLALECFVREAAELRLEPPASVPLDAVVELELRP